MISAKETIGKGGFGCVTWTCIWCSKMACFGTHPTGPCSSFGFSSTLVTLVIMSNSEGSYVSDVKTSS